MRGKVRQWAGKVGIKLGQRDQRRTDRAAGEMVLDLSPLLSRRARLESRRSASKTNAADAISTARAATGPGLRLIYQIDGIDEAPRLLSDRRPELVARRTQCFNPGHVVLAELLPGASPPSQSVGSQESCVTRAGAGAGRSTRRYSPCS